MTINLFIYSSGLHLQDIAWIEETVPERLPNKEKLIHWNKRTQIWEIIREILVSQSVNYNLVKIHQICDLLINLDKKIQELSTHAGPDGTPASNDDEANAADKLDSQPWLTF